MNLFEAAGEEARKKEEPLAYRMCPQTLDEVVGQKHIIGKDNLLYRAIKADKLGSLIFYGPPGTGKTTLARVIASSTSAAFRQVNAVSAGKKDLENVIAGAKDRREEDDTVHRRDPQVQQSPAGLPAAVRGERYGDADRRNDGEPVF